MGLRDWSSGALALAAMLLAGEAAALSARDSAARVHFDGLLPGVEYRLEGPPARMTVTDTGHEPIVVSVILAPPSRDELADGYEPLPASCFKLLTRRMDLDSGQTGTVEGRLSLPSGARDGPGQFQLEWTSEARTKAGVSLRLVSKVLVSIGEDEGLLTREKARAPKERAEFSIFGRERRVEQAPLGRAVPLERLAGALKVANLGAGRAVLSVRSVDAGEAWPGLPKGFSPAPNPRFIRAGRPFVEVAPSGIVSLPLVFDVPDEPRYRGRRWAFVVRVSDLANDDGLPQDFRILVVTGGQR